VLVLPVSGDDWSVELFLKSESDFKKYLCSRLKHSVDIVPIESNVGRGVPDLNMCCEGKETWVELKIFTGGRVLLRPEQFAWGMRRVAHGGRVQVLALHPNDRIHFWTYPFLVVPHGKYVSVTGLNTSCEINNTAAILTLLFT